MIEYNPASGLVYWSNSASCLSLRGCLAGSIGRDGRRRIRYEGRRYFVSRVAYAKVRGDPGPDVLVDHINGNPSDDRLCNLRAATYAVNAQNQTRPRRDNTTGFAGVTAVARKNGTRFKAQIRVGKSRKTIGIFDSPEDAYSAYVVAKRALHAGCTL